MFCVSSSSSSSYNSSSLDSEFLIGNYVDPIHYNNIFSLQHGIVNMVLWNGGPLAC